MRDTDYATELSYARDVDGHCIERLHIKAYDRPEIRFSWWKENRLVMRPLDLPEDRLLPLFAAAMAEGVFTDAFLRGLQDVLTQHFAGKKSGQSATSPPS